VGALPTVGALALAGSVITPTQAAPDAADSAPRAGEAAAAPYKVLVVGKTLGFRHSHIDGTTNAVIALGQQHGFTVDVWDPPLPPRSPGQPTLTLPSTPFTSAQDLGQYATILFASNVDGTNNQDPARPRTLDDAELAALQGYIRNGGGFVGLRAATDAMHAVPWYGRLTGGGARFRNHPAQQTATMRVESPTHLVDGGGDCATFKEVGTITADLGTGSHRQVKLAGDVADYLDAAEQAHEDGRTRPRWTSSSRRRERRTVSRTPLSSPRSPT